MNCIRSLEFIEKISRKYGKFGLKTVLVHPPEWEFERYKKNILPALKMHGIRFPVIIDKNKKIIKKLGINFWPTQILIRDGKIVYKHAGEGSYKKLEGSIARFLKIRPKKLFAEEPKHSKYPAVYCGRRKNGKIRKLSKILKFGIVYALGKFSQKSEFLQLPKNSAITILTRGKVINFVAGSFGSKPARAGIIMNDRIIGTVSIKNPGLYKLVESGKNRQNKLTIAPRSGMKIYSFFFQ